MQKIEFSPKAENPRLNYFPPSGQLRNMITLLYTVSLESLCFIIMSEIALYSHGGYTECVIARNGIAILTRV